MVWILSEHITTAGTAEAVSFAIIPASERGRAASERGRGATDSGAIQRV